MPGDGGAAVLVLTAAAGVSDAVAEAAGRAVGAAPRRLAASAVELPLAGALPDGFAARGATRTWCRRSDGGSGC